MDVIRYIQNSFGLLFFKDKSYDFIDKKVTWVDAVIVTAIFSLLSLTLNLGFTFYSVGSQALIESLSGIITDYIGSLVFMVVILGIAHGIFLLLQGKAKFEEFVKFALTIHLAPTLLFYGFLILVVLLMLPFQSSQDALGLMMVFGFVIMIIALGILVWTIIVAAKNYAKLYKISYGKALFVVLIPIILMFILFFIGIIIGFSSLAF